MEKNNHENKLNPIQLEKLDKYAELIYFENKKYNLTGLKNIKDIKNVLISESSFESCSRFEFISNELTLLISSLLLALMVSVMPSST